MKSSRKSEKSSKKISTPSKSQPDGDPTEPNVVLTMVLDEAITPQLCEDLKRSLKVRNDFTVSKMIVTGDYYIHKWELTVSDPESFKRAVTRFPESRKRVGLYAEAITPREAEPASGEPGARRYLEPVYALARLASAISRLGGQ